jgi:hypothetical protein
MLRSFFCQVIDEVDEGANVMMLTTPIYARSI